MLNYKLIKSVIDALFRNKNNKSMRKRHNFRNDNKWRTQIKIILYEIKNNK